jgi:hypothetical protein
MKEYSEEIVAAMERYQKRCNEAATPPVVAHAIVRGPVNVSRLAMPLTVGVSIIIAVASLLYSTGSKVSGNDKDVAYLQSKVDALQVQLKDAVVARLESDHDAVIRLDQRVVSLEAAEAGKNITVTVADPKDKK